MNKKEWEELAMQLSAEGECILYNGICGGYRTLLTHAAGDNIVRLHQERLDSDEGGIQRDVVLMVLGEARELLKILEAH